MALCNNIQNSNTLNNSAVSYQYHRMANGIRLVFRRNQSVVMHCGVYINAGSRDETKDEEGMAHFIEHAIFKGTKKRKSYHILNRIDGVGGELNAYTTKEETCIYASAMTQHIDRCLELFADIIFNSTFPEKELAKETDVIIDEINSYKDTPSELIFDDFEELYFGGHSLAHNILGTPRNIRKFNTNKILSFVKRNYTTDKMVISIVGNIDFQRVVHICEKYFGTQPATVSAGGRQAVTSTNSFAEKRHRHGHQTHALFGCPAYSSFDDKRMVFTLINNILGGPAMNSRLNVAVREKYGLCYNIETQYSLFSDSGIFYIYMAMHPDFKDKIIELVFKELDKLKNIPLSTAQLHMYKMQLIGQMAINNEQPLNEMQSIGKSFLVYDRVDTIDEISAEINGITSQQILDAANEILNREQFSQLIYN